MRVTGVVIQRRQPLLLAFDAQFLRLSVCLHSPGILRAGHRRTGVCARGVKVHVRHVLETFCDGIQRLALNDAQVDLVRYGAPVPALVCRDVDFVVGQQVGHVAQKPRHRRPVDQLKADVDVPALLDLVRRPVRVIGKRLRRRIIDDLRRQLVGIRQRFSQRGQHRSPVLALKHLTGQPIAVGLLRDLAFFHLLAEFRLVAPEPSEELVELALHVDLRAAVGQPDALHQRRDLLICPNVRLVAHPLSSYHFRDPTKMVLSLSSDCPALSVYPLGSQRAASLLQ